DRRLRARSFPTQHPLARRTSTMPLKLNVGVSQKVGLPNYGSVGASCNLEMELEAGLLEKDLDGFHARIRGGAIAPVPLIMRPFWAFSPPNPPESPSQEVSSPASMLETPEARHRSAG